MVSKATAAPDPRQRILTEATRLFAAAGFEGTSLKEVADAVGLSKPAVLHHFGSKEELRTAVIESILAHWNREMPRLLLAASGSGDRFDAVLGELTRFFRDDPNRARMLLREALDRPAEFGALLRGPVRPWLKAVSGYIEAGKNNGKHYGEVDPEAYVVMVMEMVIFAAATANLAPAVLPGQDAAGRCERELSRIAKSALFMSEPAAKRGAIVRTGTVALSRPKKKTAARATDLRGKSSRPRRSA